MTEEEKAAWEALKAKLTEEEEAVLLKVLERAYDDGRADGAEMGHEIAEPFLTGFRLGGTSFGGPA